MNKKGLSYVDWAVSFGLFVIYLLAIFILLRPAISDSYNSEFLSTIVKQGMEEDSYIELSLYPVFVEIIAGHPSSISLPLPAGYDFLNDSNMILLDSVQSQLNTQIAGNNLNFEYIFSTGINKFTIVHSDMISYTNTLPGAISPGDFNYTIGIEENKEGLYEDLFLNLPDYQDLKSDWGYPMNHEFAIYIYNSTELKSENIILYKNETELPQDKVVNVLKWSDWKLNSNSTDESITILIQTW